MHTQTEPKQTVSWFKAAMPQIRCFVCHEKWRGDTILHARRDHWTRLVVAFCCVPCLDDVHAWVEELNELSPGEPNVAYWQANLVQLDKGQCSRRQLRRYQRGWKLLDYRLSGYAGQ